MLRTVQNYFRFYLSFTCRVLSCHKSTCSAGVYKALHIKPLLLLLNNLLSKPTTWRYWSYITKTQTCWETLLFYFAVCPQLSSLGLHSSRASNTNSFHNSASSRVYASSPSVVPAQIFEGSCSKTDEVTDGAKKNKTRQTFGMLWLNMGDMVPSQGDSTDRRNTLGFEWITMMYKACLGKRKIADLMRF